MGRPRPGRVARSTPGTPRGSDVGIKCVVLQRCRRWRGGRGRGTPWVPAPDVSRRKQKQTPKRAAAEGAWPVWTRGAPGAGVQVDGTCADCGPLWTQVGCSCCARPDVLCECMGQGGDNARGNVRYTAIGRIQDRVLIATYHHYTTGAPASKVGAAAVRTTSNFGSSPSLRHIQQDCAYGPQCGVQYLAVAQKVLNSDKVLSQQSANVPNAVDDASCLMQTDKKYMFIGLCASCLYIHIYTNTHTNTHAHTHTHPV